MNNPITQYACGIYLFLLLAVVSCQGSKDQGYLLPEFSLDLYRPEKHWEPISFIREEDKQRFRSEISRGDGITQILSRHRINRQDIFTLTTALDEAFDLRLSKPRDQVYVVRDPELGRVNYLEYERNPIHIYACERDPRGFYCFKKEIQTKVKHLKLGAVIKSSLYASILSSGESPMLVSFFVDVFAWDINFFTDTRNGDTVKIIVEKIYQNNDFVEYGRVLAAEYDGQVVGKLRVFRYKNRKGTEDLFDQVGNAIRKSFLKTPLKYVLITSGFSYARYHPILHRFTTHLGVDYGAPIGTPVWAVATGIVQQAGWFGGYGNFISIRHDNGYVSRYGHLSRISGGVSPGKRVSQKTVIGTVGTTGMSTGPHLHFELILKGKYINPLKVKMIRSASVARPEIGAFRAQIAPLLTEMEEIVPLKY